MAAAAVAALLVRFETIAALVVAVVSYNVKMGGDIAAFIELM